MQRRITNQLNDQTQMEFEALVRVREEQVNANIHGPGHRLGGEAINEPDIFDVIQLREQQRNVIRERRLAYFDAPNERPGANQNFINALEADEPFFDPRAHYFNNNVPIYHGVRNFFNRDAFGRRNIFNLDQVEDARIADMGEQMAEQGAIPELPVHANELDRITRGELVELRHRIAENVADLRNADPNGLIFYRNQLNRVRENLRGMPVGGLHEFEEGLYAVFGLLRAPVLFYLLAHLDIALIVNGVNGLQFGFIAGLLELLRPFFLTVLDIRYWAANTLGELQAGMLRALNVLRFERHAIWNGRHFWNNARLAVRDLRNNFPTVWNNLVAAMQADIRRITFRRFWESRIVRGAIIGGLFGIGRLIIYNPDTFWQGLLRWRELVLRYLPDNNQLLSLENWEFFSEFYQALLALLSSYTGS